jgi:hypothetical protein
MHDDLPEASTTARSEELQQQRTQAAHAAKRRRGAAAGEFGLNQDPATEGWHLLGLTHQELKCQLKAKDKWFTLNQVRQ